MPKKKHECILCQRASGERVLLQAEKEGQTIWVCVRCLPVLIHGSEE
jgi:hypothetical protein